MKDNQNRMSCFGPTMYNIGDMTQKGLLPIIADITFPELKECLYLGMITLSLWLIYYYLYLPLNWRKDLSSVGYGHLTPLPKGTKRELVDLAKRRRQLGSLPPVYPNGWFMIAESNEIREGQVKHVFALGENLAVFRTREGVVCVLDAYCPHMGANMGVGGKVHGDCLECPFHKWRFNGHDGSCTQVPYSKKTPAFAKAKKWLSCEINEFIFIWYHAEKEEPSWYPEDIQEIKSKKYIYRGRNEFFVNCHIQEVPENGADLSHFSAVHSSSMLCGSDLRLKDKSWFKFFQHEWTSVGWEPDSTAGRKHIGLCSLTHHIVLFDSMKLASCHLNISQIGPGYVTLIMNTSFGPLMLLQTVTPIEPTLQRIVHRIYCPPLLALYATFALITESIMIERDIMVWNHKKYVDNPLLVKEESSIAKYRRWFSQFYSENSPRIEDLNQLDW